MGAESKLSRLRAFEPAGEIPSVVEGTPKNPEDFSISHADSGSLLHALSLGVPTKRI